MIGREDEVREYRDRVRPFYYLIFFFFALIGARVFYLQVMRGDELRKFSEANRLKKEKLFPSRGVIFDRSGKVIVDNRAAFDVVLLTQYYPFTHEINQRLAKVLDIPVDEFEKKLSKVSKSPSFYPILLKADVSKDVLSGIEMDASGFPGVDIEANVQRRYPFGAIASQILGYVGEVDPKDLTDQQKQLQSGDLIGKAGLEKTYDNFLRGINGVGYVEVDAMGRRKKTDGEERLLGFVAQTDPAPGSNLSLTLDMDLEQAADKALRDRNYMGSVVALDPRNGEILAMVNEPSYDPEVISGREISQKTWTELSRNIDRPLRNRAIQDTYPPGSTFKPIIAVAALAEGVATAKSTYSCHGSMLFGKRKFSCWKTHGGLDFVRAIKESCDIVFYNLGLQLGIDNIAKYARMFGLGTRTGLKLSNEQKGLIPDSDWKMKTFKEPWQAGETLSVAIGQGADTVTPLQMASAYAAIANGGFVYRPYLVRKIDGKNGEVLREFQPELSRKIEVPSEVFEVVKEGLHRVVNEPGGTAFLSHSKIADISGKTGSAQVRAFSDIMKACEKRDFKDRHHAWFVGYAPRDNPQIVVAAIAEHQCHGSSAAHVAKDVIEAYFLKQQPELKEKLKAPATRLELTKAAPSNEDLKSEPKGEDDE
jgi:penicillin-binding protein 2